MNWPYKHILLPKMAGKIRYAQFLHDGSEVLFRENSKEVNAALHAQCPEGDVALELPVLRRGMAPRRPREKRTIQGRRCGMII